MRRSVEFVGDVPWDVKKFGRILDDQLLSVVRLYIIGKFQGNDFDPRPQHLLDAINAVAFSNRFNPVADYLAAVEPNWDGVPRVEKLFGAYFNCGIDAYSKGVSTAFAVGAVRRIRNPGTKFDTMPVLKSPQGWNKSTALRTLFSDEFFSDSPLGSLKDKDAPMKLRGIWGYELAEIESLRKPEVNALKAFMSQQTDRQRDPYGRLMGEVPRSNVFVATVNEGGYLGDQTGGRRFWPLDVLARIDVAKLAADRDQIWAEAATLESSGISNVLPTDLWQAAAARQDAETLDDPWEDALRQFIAVRASASDADPVGDEENFGREALPPDRVHTSELFDALGIAEKDQTRMHAVRLRGVMVSRLGWQHTKAVRINGANKAGYELG